MTWWMSRGEGKGRNEHYPAQDLPDLPPTTLPTISKCDSEPVRLNYPHLLNLSSVGFQSTHTYSYILVAVHSGEIAAHTLWSHTRAIPHLLYFSRMNTQKLGTAYNGIELTWGYLHITLVYCHTEREKHLKWALHTGYALDFDVRESNGNTAYYGTYK